MCVYTVHTSRRNFKELIKKPIKLQSHYSSFDRAMGDKNFSQYLLSFAYDFSYTRAPAYTGVAYTYIHIYTPPLRRRGSPEDQVYLIAIGFREMQSHAPTQPINYAHSYIAVRAASFFY